MHWLKSHPEVNLEQITLEKKQRKMERRPINHFHCRSILPISFIIPETLQQMLNKEFTIYSSFKQLYAEPKLLEIRPSCNGIWKQDEVKANYAKIWGCNGVYPVKTFKYVCNNGCCMLKWTDLN
jgi:hypothetical protein